MDNQKIICCTDCGRPITYKDDLVISGKLLQPYHQACFMNPDSFAGKMNRFYGPFPLRFRFWVWLIVGNLISGVILMMETGADTILCGFIILCNGVFISARLGIYFSYEKYLMKGSG